LKKKTAEYRDIVPVVEETANSRAGGCKAEKKKCTQGTYKTKERTCKKRKAFKARKK